jgi:hypothetical protein
MSAKAPAMRVGEAAMYAADDARDGVRRLVLERATPRQRTAVEAAEDDFKATMEAERSRFATERKSERVLALEAAVKAAAAVALRDARQRGSYFPRVFFDGRWMCWGDATAAEIATVDAFNAELAALDTAFELARDAARRKRDAAIVAALGDDGRDLIAARDAAALAYQAGRYTSRETPEEAASRDAAAVRAAELAERAAARAWARARRWRRPVCAGRPLRATPRRSRARAPRRAVRFAAQASAGSGADAPPSPEPDPARARASRLPAWRCWS